MFQKNCPLPATRCPLFIILLAVFAAPVFAAPLEDLVGADRAAVLRAASEPVTEVQQKTPVLILAPRHAEIQRLVAEIQSSLEPNLFVETLSLYPGPAAAEWDAARQTGLLNHLAALSTLSGIQYYSASRGAMRVFYESSTVIDGPASKNPLPDPVYSSLPPSFALYARQKDLTFGDNVYRFDFRTGGDYLFFVQENISAMNAGVIPAIGKNKFRSLIAVIDAGDCLLIYAAAMAKTAPLPGMGDRISASFTNRAAAILKWFEGRLNL